MIVKFDESKNQTKSLKKLSTLDPQNLNQNPAGKKSGRLCQAVYKASYGDPRKYFCI